MFVNHNCPLISYNSLVQLVAFHNSKLLQFSSVQFNIGLHLYSASTNVSNALP